MKRLLKKASSDMDSSTSAKMCSSPPKENRVCMGPWPPVADGADYFAVEGQERSAPPAQPLLRQDLRYAMPATFEPGGTKPPGLYVGVANSHVDLGDRLTGHHGLLIFGKETHDLARCACLHLVERLHDLDETNGVVLRDRVAFGFVGWFVRRRLAVEYAWEGRNDFLYAHEFLILWSLRPWPAAPQRAAR